MYCNAIVLGGLWYPLGFKNCSWTWHAVSNRVENAAHVAACGRFCALATAPTYLVLCCHVSFSIDHDVLHDHV